MSPGRNFQRLVDERRRSILYGPSNVSRFTKLKLSYILLVDRVHHNNSPDLPKTRRAGKAGEQAYLFW